MKKIRSSEITPEQTYWSRRKFLIGIGAVAGTALINSACDRVDKLIKPSGPPSKSPVSGATKDDLGAKLTAFKDITSYNNFYEFSTDKEEVANLSANFETRPWSVTVGGHVRRPKTYAVEDLLKKFKSEERIYRLRCVEAWSMVIPWLGFSLSEILKEAEPASKAKFVRFTTLYDPSRFPGQQDYSFDWPYVEGLRLDEAMNKLTILSTGLYGKDLLPQNGAPLRLVVPWKYGFKSIKSIVKIDLVEKKPQSLWMRSTPDEYGFYANVNPDVQHPRWSQSSERRIGEFSRRKTLLFNGYTEEVGYMYEKMNLKKDF